MAVLKHALGVDALGTVPIAGEYRISSPLTGFIFSDPHNGVGTMYEVGINGVGLMIADTADKPAYTRQSAQVEIPRFATGATPFSEAVDRYTFVAFSDLSDGAGQRFVDREDSSPKAYWDSRRVDPFSQPGRLMPLKALSSVRSVTARTSATTNTNPWSKPDYPLVFLKNGEGLYLDDDRNVKKVSDGTAVYTGGSEVWSMHTDGRTTLMGLFDGTFRSSVDGAAVTTPTVNGIATVDGDAAYVTCVYWSTTANRWCVGVQTGTNKAAFTTLSGKATPYSNEMGTNLYRHSALSGGTGFNATCIRSITDGGGNVWFAVTDIGGAYNSIYAWKAGSADAPTLAYRFASGEVPFSIFYHQGNLFCRALTPTARGDQLTVSIFRFIQQGSQLVPVAILDLDSLDTSSTTSILFRSHILGGWAAYGARIYFGWKYDHGSGTYGTGSIDLTTGGYAKWWDVDATASNTAAVDGLAVSSTGVPYVLVPGVGLYSANGAETTGWLVTSYSDLASTIDKRIDSVALTSQGHDAASPSGDVRTMIGSDQSGPWSDITDAAGNLQNTFGATTIERYPEDTVMDVFTLRVELTPGGTGTYHDKTVVRLHPLGLVDDMLQVAINCSDNPRSLSGSPLSGGDGKGSDRARWLESLTQTIVTFQDIDWEVGDEPTKWEILNVEVTGRNSRQPSSGRASQDLTATVTMRRFIK